MGCVNYQVNLRTQTSKLIDVGLWNAFLSYHFSTDLSYSIILLTIHPGSTPLHHASANGNTDCMSILLDKGAEISKTDEDGKNCLDLAVENGQVDACMALIQHKRFVVQVQCPLFLILGVELFTFKPLKTFLTTPFNQSQLKSSTFLAKKRPIIF